jgi:two-component system, NtrC family, response regulator HydG
MPRLQFRADGRDLFTHLLRPGRTLIGRSDRCDVALPSDHVSRVHCALEQRTDGWWLVDRSRNGTLVNGKTVPEVRLENRDVLELGQFEATFYAEGMPTQSPTANTVRPRPFEELVEVGPERVAATRAELTVSRGPGGGRTLTLDRPLTTVGGPGSHVVIDGMDGTVLRIRVVRGRVMVEPTGAAVYLGGSRVREITPALSGEEIRAGEHAFTVDVRTIDDHDDEREEFGAMVGRSPVMKKLFATLARMAAHDDIVLLTGESGTGKELAAHAVHEAGPRHDGPFVAVNCAAVAESLFESELFGHEKGAFTGAVARQDGAFQRAHEGTLFLDEIGELKLDMQAKLLRALESGEVRRVGGSAPEFPDARIVAATNRDLVAMVRAGTFRSDLYFRLAVLSVRLPPLRERIGDVPALARKILEKIDPSATFAEDALAFLVGHDWPGNVRELRNVLTRAYVMGGKLVQREAIEYFPAVFDGPDAAPASGAELERNLVLSALKKNDGNRTQAARELGIPRSSLLYRMRRLGIEST